MAGRFGPPFPRKWPRRAGTKPIRQTGPVAQNAVNAGDVHLEVWKDLDNNEVNKAAAEWIYPPGTKDPREPWVFVVGRDGRISRRFDNVATDAELEQAVVDVTR